jgi:hypothetical protein
MKRDDDDGRNQAAPGRGEKPTTPDDRIEDLLASRQEFLQVFKRGAEFTEELLRENERLRYRVAELEGVEREKDDFASRYVEIEQENNNLLNIYVATYQLHSTLDYEEVLRAITEVVLNFIGAEIFTVTAVESTARGGWEPRLLVAEGLDWETAAQVPVSPVAHEVIETGVPHFVSELEGVSADLTAPLVVVPLKIKELTIGVLSIYKFLQQKKRLASVDHELFTLLAGHAATAVFAAKLYTDSKRKLSTIQGFIDLVTSSSTSE